MTKPKHSPRGSTAPKAGKAAASQATASPRCEAPAIPSAEGDPAMGEPYETTDKARSRSRTETERDDKSYFGTVRENSDIGIEEAWSANIKRTYDEFQHESLEAVRRGRSHFDKALVDAAEYENARRQISVQVLQNAVETANMLGKQAVRHGDLMIDRQVNVNATDAHEVNLASLSAKTGVEQSAFITTLAQAIVDGLKTASNK